MNAVARPVSSGRAMSNTYILEVSSGTRRGGGTADNILYFSVKYTDRNGVKRTACLMPGEDAQQLSLQAAYEQGNRDARQKMAADSFGYTVKRLLERKALGNIQTDQLLFTTPEEVKNIDAISVFGRTTNAASTWSCQGMRVYRVDTLYGLDMYGWYSDLGYIDFAGDVVAQVMMLNGAGNLRWSASGGVFNFLPYGNAENATGCCLVTEESRADYDTSGNPAHALGHHHDSQTKNTVTFRLDLADLGGAGFECLAGSYASGSRSTVSSLKYCETAALIIRYTDVFGCTREVALPVVINALGQLVEVAGDAAIAGYAQQGDSVAFQAMLPDFRELTNAYLTLGEPSAVGTAQLTDVFVDQTRISEDTGKTTVKGANAAYGPDMGVALYIRPSNVEQSLALSPGKTGSWNQITTQAPSAAKDYWFFESTGTEGVYHIVSSVKSGGKNAVVGAAAHNNGVVGIYYPNGSATQRWTLEQAGDNLFYIVSAADPSLYLAVQSDSTATGAGLIVRKKDEGAGQKFYLRTLSGEDAAKAAESQQDETEENQEEKREILKESDVRRERRAASEKDVIRYTCFAVYQGAELGVRVNGATVQYQYSGVPARYATASSVEGLTVSTGERTAITLICLLAQS